MPASQASGNTDARGQYDNVACPFCGILCDDLSIARNGSSLKVTANGCPKAIAGFERDVSDAKPQIGGKDATLAQAITEAANLLKASRQPILGGLGTDVDGMRAVLELAERTGAVVDHALSEAQYRNFRVLQSTGWVMSTLTEARNRADLFVIVGSDLHAMHPRLFERVINAERSMFSDSPPKRTVVFLGEGLDTSAAQGSRIGDIISLPAKPERIAEILVAMRAMAKGVAVSGDTIGGLPRAAVEDLLERCKKSSYGIMAWAPPAFDFANADLTVQAISEFIKDINQHSRFAGLSLAGNEGAVSAGAVCAWQSGYPLRVSFATGKPIYDIERFSMSRMLAAKESDLLVWIAGFTPDLSPPDTDVPTVVLGTPGLKLSRTPKVFIPIGTPGADHSGLLIRCDNVVALPLQKLGRADLPSASSVLAHIQAAL
ncbi:MAG: formylmethanofuran dehydrogenase [Hyphomicrobium sp.]